MCKKLQQNLFYVERERDEINNSVCQIIMQNCFQGRREYFVLPAACFLLGKTALQAVNIF